MNVSSPLPDQLRRIVGSLPDRGQLPEGDPYPFEVVTPDHDGVVEREGVRTYFAVFSEAETTIVFTPICWPCSMSSISHCVP